MKLDYVLGHTWERNCKKRVKKEEKWRFGGLSGGGVLDLLSALGNDYGTVTPTPSGHWNRQCPKFFETSEGQNIFDGMFKKVF